MSVRRDNRVSIFTMDPATGKVAWRQQVPVEGGPDPLAFDPQRRFLYVACRDRQQVSSYRIDPVTGGLSLVNTVPLQGEPIQIVTDRTGRYLLSVFFYQSTIGVHAIDDQGVIARPADRMAGHLLRVPRHRSRPVEPLRVRAPRGPQRRTERRGPVPLRRARPGVSHGMLRPSSR